MAKVVRLNAPASMRVTEMPKEEIERHVAGLADRALDLAGENRFVGVNAVALGQIAGDTTVWAQWTRACCGSRQRIDDYTDPVAEDYGITPGVLPESIARGHLESHFQVVELQGDDHVGG
ncbi:hypothetical protein [Mycolicibacterium helvum]|uniref:Uncharacterized protein n=1 Tax=Mycolicibacterium helvum TaxID=1534349 RepID=A0A7I7T8X5_9MYCO|nr:hypothetical protein [Mycolicibacterium helvum]BBY65528.1 hypothetical protein MHEL_37710 [Mycolicibacterium helvum]